MSQVLVGVMSWVVPCGTGVPDAYARVSSHYEWIVAALTTPMEEGTQEEPGPTSEDETLKFSPIVAPEQVMEVR